MAERRAARQGGEPLPTSIQPMLAEAGALPGAGEGWAYEFKWDGVRAIVYLADGRVRAESRNAKDLTGSFPELGELPDLLGGRRAVLDGELVSLDEEGRPSFGRLQQRLHLGGRQLVERRAGEYPTSLLVFDLLYLDGELLLDAPYEERRARLEGLGLSAPHLATPPSVAGGDGGALLEVARERGLEGLVVKRLGSRYAPGRRNGAWRKVKIFCTQEVVIGGWTEGRGERKGSLGALLLGLPGPEGLVYVGKVGTGFSEGARRSLLELLAPLAREDSPFTVPFSPAETRLARFVRPELVGEVQYGEWTGDGHLRHPSWRGLRPDKGPGEVVLEP